MQIFFLSFIGQLIRTMIDSSEKYLFEYDNINPFYALLFEGFFGFLLSIAYDLYYNPFDNISEFKKNKSYSEFAILIISK